MLYLLNLILNFSQNLALFRQKRILRSTRNSQKQSNFLLNHLINSWLHFTNNKSSTPTCTEEIFDQSIFLNPNTKLNFRSNNSYFHCVPPKIISKKFNLIKDLGRSLQPGLTFKKKLSLFNVSHKR